MLKEIKYKGYTIEKSLSGWYIHGRLKADTLAGIKMLINRSIKNSF